LPSNQDALRLAVKALGDSPEGARVVKLPCVNCGRDFEMSATLFAQSSGPARCRECSENTESFWVGAMIGAITDKGLTMVERAEQISRLEEQRAKFETKRGRVLSARNEQRLREALAALEDVLAQLEQQPASGDDDKAATKSAIPPHTTLTADPDTEWDAGAVLTELPSERAALRRVHAWVDDKADPDTKGAYKFPHHLADGRVVLRGVNNARARLPQASIPEADRAGVDRHLTTHQAQYEQAAVTLDYARALKEMAAEIFELGDEAERELADSLQILVSTLQEVYS